jgi:hypothetical protein
MRLQAAGSRPTMRLQAAGSRPGTLPGLSSAGFGVASRSKRRSKQRAPGGCWLDLFHLTLYVPRGRGLNRASSSSSGVRADFSTAISNVVDLTTVLGAAWAAGSLYYNFKLDMVEKDLKTVEKDVKTVKEEMATKEQLQELKVELKNDVKESEGRVLAHLQSAEARTEASEARMLAHLQSSEARTEASEARVLAHLQSSEARTEASEARVLAHLQSSEARVMAAIVENKV